MSTFYEDNMNIKKINGFTLQQVSRDVWAIDEFGIDIMYLIIGTERALLIDTGIGIGNIRSVVETMTHLPYDVVNTHHHYDHVGGNGRFSMVYAHKKAIPVIQEQNNLQSRKEFFRSQEARPEYNYEASLEFDASIMGDFEMKGIEEGFVFHLGNRDLEVLDTPGHTKDGICLLDRKYRLLFSGDTVVSTPVLMFDTFSDTMSTYLESLKKLAQLRNSYELIFPGHYLRPIGSIYIDDQIACIQEILEKHLLGEKEECGMTKSEVYFYQKALGLKVERTKEANDGSFILTYLGDGLSNFQIELTWLRDHPQAYELGENESHICFEVDDYQKAYELHKEMGCICFENKEMGLYFINDPDDYWIEILPLR